MGKVYDNWGKLFVAVSKREELNQTALCPSLTSSSSVADSNSTKSGNTAHHTTVRLVDFTFTYSRIGAGYSTGLKFMHVGTVLRTTGNRRGLSDTSNDKQNHYSFANFKYAKGDFKADMVLGVGHFGTVYKGWINRKKLTPSKPGTGMPVAIRKLNTGCRQGIGFLQTRIGYLGTLSHPNLVKLLGYAREDEQHFLVNEFVNKGNLEHHLFGRHSDSKRLSWDIRLKVAIGAARGLAYLHSSGLQIIHGHFKTPSVLLDKSYNAKLSDFGLETLVLFGSDPDATNRDTGSCGYAAPEYIEKGHLNARTDVYAFGIMLLEMLTGLRALDTSQPTRPVLLVDRMRPQKQKLKSVMDARIEGQYSSEVALQAAQLTLRCLEPEPRKRPSMKEVVEVLEQIATVKLWFCFRTNAINQSYYRIRDGNSLKLRMERRVNIKFVCIGYDKTFKIPSVKDKKSRQ